VVPAVPVVIIIIAFVTTLKNAALPRCGDIQQVAEFLKSRCFVWFFSFYRTVLRHCCAPFSDYQFFRVIP
jgi:hypothetical protein